MIKATLIVKSTKALVPGKTSVKYPSLEIIPLELDGDLEWLIDNVSAKPTFDNLTQKLVRSRDVVDTPHPDYLDFNQYLTSWSVVELDETELEDLEDSEANNKMQLYELDGKDLVLKTGKKIWRKKNKAEHLTRNQARKLMRWFLPTYINLSFGDWNEANKEILDTALIQNITDEADNAMTNIYEFLRDEIAAYLTDYDL